MRTTVLPGAVVRGSDGQLVGRVHDIYVHDRSGELAAITVKLGQLSSRTVLIPVAAIAEPVAGPGTASGGGRAGGRRGDGNRADGGLGTPDAPTAEAPTADAAAATADARATEAQTKPDDAPTKPDDAPSGQGTAVHLRVDSMTVRAGISAPETDHATPEQLRLAARELGIEETPAG